MEGTKDITSGDHLIGELRKFDLKDTFNGAKEEVSGVVLAPSKEEEERDTRVITEKGVLEINGVDGGVFNVKGDDSVMKKGETQIDLTGEEEETLKKGMKEVRIDEKGINWSEIVVEEEHDLVEVEDHEISCGIKYEKSGDQETSEGPNGGADGDYLELKHEKNRRHRYPLRPEAEDCSYYMRTGTCKFVKNCKFNHPLKRRSQARKVVSKQREENFDGLGQIECKYYLTAGGCKHGDTCRYNHSRGKTGMAPNLEFNFLGLPIRQGEIECPHYMRNGSCKFGSFCKFSHPDPTSKERGEPLPGHGNLEEVASGWSLKETSLVSPVYLPAVGPPNLQWTGYQGPIYTLSEISLCAPPVMSHPASSANIYLQHQHQMLVEEFPVQSGQPESQEYTSRITQSPMIVSCPLNDKGLPLRPDKDICAYYNRYRICKYGRACKFDHPGNAVPAV